MTRPALLFVPATQDVELAVWDWPGLGPPAVFVHGTGFHGRCWDESVRALPGRRSIALDLRCHGRSPTPPPPYPWLSFAEDIAAVMDRMNVRGAIGVGHSMGGHALAIAATLDPAAFSGTFKVFHTEQDGYEQVLGFVARAEMLGFDAVCLQQHSTEAVALEDSTVFVMLVRDLFSLCERSPGFGRLLHMSVSNALARQGELADVMAAVSSEVRLARFLLQLSRRMVAVGQSPRRLLLRMSRRDIASHLGVAHETISRSFKVMAEWGLVEVDNREVEVLDMARLQAFSQGTRRQIDDGSRLRPAPPVALRGCAA